MLHLSKYASPSEERDLNPAKMRRTALCEPPGTTCLQNSLVLRNRRTFPPSFVTSALPAAQMSSPSSAPYLAKQWRGKPPSTAGLSIFEDTHSLSLVLNTAVVQGLCFWVGHFMHLCWSMTGRYAHPHTCMQTVRLWWRLLGPSSAHASFLRPLPFCWTNMASLGVKEITSGSVQLGWKHCGRESCH